MICKKAIKNAVIFTAMLLIVGINSTPLISKAGNSFGVAFSVDGETTFTDTQSKSTSSSVQMLCTDKDIDGSYYYGKVYAYKSGQYYDVSHGYEYYFDVNETHNMLNWVNEEGYTRAAVRCEAYCMVWWLLVSRYLGGLIIETEKNNCLFTIINCVVWLHNTAF
ncbi:MAG: hypothetical protein BHW23_02360 [Lachnospira eligens]|nr:MAG: hypothetical protein BHW23_02360 [Lachnospira eligens]